MRLLSTAFLLCALLVGPLRGQQQEPLDLRLTTISDVALIGGDVQLKLRIEVFKDLKIGRAFLSGLNLKSSVDGKPGPRVGKSDSSRVQLRAGTVIERVLSFPVAAVIKKPSETGVTRVSLSWATRPELSTSVSVAPDLRNVDVSRLDLSKTRVLLVTNYGDMLLKFRPDKAPKHVAAFVKLCKDGFYDGTKFHRVLRGFMIQGGCPNTKDGALGAPGTGGPGYTLDAEFNDIRHVRGVLSMARGPAVNSAGCQFFIVHQETTSLNGKYTAFGELVQGLDVLDKIAAVPCRKGSSVDTKPSTPIKPVHLKAAVVQPVFRAK